jgi:hypothetical protein
MTIVIMQRIFVLLRIYERDYWSGSVCRSALNIICKLGKNRGGVGGAWSSVELGGGVGPVQVCVNVGLAVIPHYIKSAGPSDHSHSDLDPDSNLAHKTRNNMLAAVVHSLLA